MIDKPANQTCWTSSRQDLRLLRTETSYEADDSRTVAVRLKMFQRAADREAELEERAEVDAWRLSMTSGVQRALSIEYLTAEGLFNLEERWKSLASLRRTA